MTSTSFDSSDFRNIVPRFTPEARKANRTFVDLIAAIAERKNATPAQIALAWALAQKPWIVPIPGTTKLKRLAENIAAAAVELTSDDLREIDSAASQIALQGARYPEHLDQLTGRCESIFADVASWMVRNGSARRHARRRLTRSQSWLSESPPGRRRPACSGRGG